MEDPESAAAFRWRLAETIAWCQPHVSLTDLADSLRTPTLCPPGFTGVKHQAHRLIESVQVDGEWQYIYADDPVAATTLQPQLSYRTIQAAVEWVAEQRSQMLQQAKRYPTAPAIDLAGGRLLFYAPDCNLAEGCEQVETPFFDVFADPPWDTWVAFAEAPPVYLGSDKHWEDNYIISWVPPELIEQVDRGLRTSTTEAVQWADLFDSPLLQQLRAVGLISGLRGGVPNKGPSNSP